MSNISVEKSRKVAFYLRVSTDDQADKFGLDAQRAALEALMRTKINPATGEATFLFAGENHVYRDDISGTTKLEERPGFRKLQEDYLLADESNKPFNTVAVFKIDRFARKLKVLIDVIDFFEENSIEFISATESIDTSTAFGKAMLGIMGIIAELERENILERTRSGKEQAINKGTYMGANAPFGYQKDKNNLLIVLEEEAETVRKIFGLFTTGNLTPQKIADTLQDDDILSPDASAIFYNKRKGNSRKTNPNNFWRVETIRAILSDEIYIGIRYYDKSLKGKRLPKNEWKLSKFKHEPIIPEPLFEFAQKRLREISDRKIITQKKIDNHLYLLSGLLKCDHCMSLENLKEAESSWTGGKKRIEKLSDKYSYYYMCNRKNRKKYSLICPVVPIPADSLEEYVIDFIKQLLNDPKATYEYQKDLVSSKLNVEHLKKERIRFVRLKESIPNIKENILTQHAYGAFGDLELKEKLNELKMKLSKYDEKISQIDLEMSKEALSRGYEYSLELYSKKYSRALEEAVMDKEELYDLIHMLIDRITVYSRPRTERDSIAGRKKEIQLIPEKIDIELNLPQNLLKQLIANKFGVKSANL